MKRVNDEQELEASQEILEVGISQNAYFIMHEEPILMDIVANADLDALFRLYDTSKACRKKIDQIVAIFPLCTMLVIANFRIYNAFFTERSYKGSLVHAIRRKTTTVYINTCALPQEIRKKKIFAKFPCLQNIALRVDTNTLGVAREFFTSKFIHRRSIIIYHDHMPQHDKRGQGFQKDVIGQKSIAHARNFTRMLDPFGLLFFEDVAAAFSTNK